MTRNATLPLSPVQTERATFYAGIVSDMLHSEGSTIEFAYTPRDGGETVTRACVPIETVGTERTTTWGFKGMTENGPRTFNYYLMG